MQSKVHVSRSNCAFLSPTRENGSGSRTEKARFGRGSYLDFEPLGVLCLVTSARSKVIHVRGKYLTFRGDASITPLDGGHRCRIDLANRLREQS
ncbi:hypothetical protein EMCRGX_G017530 [Ephydatia muelleri]